MFAVMDPACASISACMLSASELPAAFAATGQATISTAIAPIKNQSCFRDQKLGCTFTTYVPPGGAARPKKSPQAVVPR